MRQWWQDRYADWLLSRWLRKRENERPTYTDARGRCWPLADVVNSKTPQELTVLSVGELWEANMRERVWGASLPALEQAYEDLVSGEYLECSVALLLRAADLTGSWTDHLSRVALFGYSLRRGQKLPPLLVGVDGEVWDGYHRLVACRAVGLLTIEACRCSTIIRDTG